MRVALATCRNLPEPDHDEALVVAALGAAGLDVRLLAWDDDAAPFTQQDLVILRSTWNYYERVDDFIAWVRKTGTATSVLNPPRIVEWSSRKTYLAELERDGVAIVPTEFVPRGGSCDVAALLTERSWKAIVIKPVVSAASFRTARFAAGSMTAAQSFLEELAADRDAMVQEWMPSVETHGERSLVWIDGALTHAVRKSPRFAGGDEQVSSGVAIADDERAFAERVLAPRASELLYARVDVVRDSANELRLMELELVEPSLFFQQSPSALARFVAAVSRRRVVR